jgi:hypothetical protein
MKYGCEKVESHTSFLSGDLKKKKKKQLGRHRRRSKHNIEMYLIKVVCDGACCINLFQHRS